MQTEKQVVKESKNGLINTSNHLQTPVAKHSPQKTVASLPRCCPLPPTLPKPPPQGTRRAHPRDRRHSAPPTLRRLTARGHQPFLRGQAETRQRAPKTAATAGPTHPLLDGRNLCRAPPMPDFVVLLLVLLFKPWRWICWRWGSCWRWAWSGRCLCRSAVGSLPFPVSSIGWSPLGKDTSCPRVVWGRGRIARVPFQVHVHANVFTFAAGGERYRFEDTRGADRGCTCDCIIRQTGRLSGQDWNFRQDVIKRPVTDGGVGMPGHKKIPVKPRQTKSCSSIGCVHAKTETEMLKVIDIGTVTLHRLCSWRGGRKRLLYPESSSCDWKKTGYTTSYVQDANKHRSPATPLKARHGRQPWQSPTCRTYFRRGFSCRSTPLSGEPSRST